MTNARPGRGSDQFILRFPDGMRDRLKTEADREGRSMNAEILARLDSSLEGPSMAYVSELEDEYNKLKNKLDNLTVLYHHHFDAETLWRNLAKKLNQRREIELRLLQIAVSYIKNGRPHLPEVMMEPTEEFISIYENQMTNVPAELGKFDEIEQQAQEQFRLVYLGEKD